MLNKTSYWLLSCTWGAALTIPGALVTLILRLLGYPVLHSAWGYVVFVGNGSSGFSLGPFAFVNIASQSLVNHEYGHSIQNCFLGPLTPFLVVIPSVCRFWFREIRHRRGVSWADMPDYDSVWFEGSATRLGEKYMSLYLKEREENLQ